MNAAVDVPVTLKCRIGVDDQEPEIALREMIAACAPSGVDTFIVHARKAWLKGLSPKENRDVPPLDYDLVARVKAENPDLTIVMNGGIATLDEAAAHLRHVDGVMLGRAAYQNPAMLAEVDARFFGGMPVHDRRTRSKPISNMSRTNCARRAAERDDQAHARPVQRPAGRARFPPPSVRERDQAGRQSSNAARRAGASVPPPARRPPPDMDFLTTTSQSDLGVFALGLVIAGVVGGLIAGMLGVGGGIVIVPVLYHVLAGLGFDEGLRMHLAVGTSLATIIPTVDLVAARPSKRGTVDWALLKSWVVPMIVGVAIGTALASYVQRAHAVADLRHRRPARRGQHGLRQGQLASGQAAAARPRRLGHRRPASAGCRR